MGRHAALIVACLLPGRLFGQTSTTCDESYSDNNNCACITFGCGDINDSMEKFKTCWAGTMQSPIDLSRANAVVADPDPGKIIFTNYANNLTSASLRAQGYSLRLDLEPTTTCTTTCDCDCDYSAGEACDCSAPTCTDTCSEPTEPDSGDLPSISGGALGPNSYEFHHALWHWGSDNKGSEHHLNGVQYAAELQLYHINKDDRDDSLAAISFFYELSDEDNALFDSLESIINENFASANTSLDEVLENIDEFLAGPVAGPVVAGRGHGLSTNMSLPLPPINLLQLLLVLPENTDNYYSYSGSLTQPVNPDENSRFDYSDCTEPVQWINYEKTIPISETILKVLHIYLAVANKVNTPLDPTRDLQCSLQCSANFRPIHDLNPTRSAVAINRQETSRVLTYRQFGYVDPEAVAAAVFSAAVGAGAIGLGALALAAVPPPAIPSANLPNPSVQFGGQAFSPSTFPDLGLVAGAGAGLAAAGVATAALAFCSAPGTCDPLIEGVIGTFRALSVESVNQALIDAINGQNLGWEAGRTHLFGESYAEVLAYRMGELPPSAGDRSGEPNRQNTLAFLQQIREAVGNRRQKREASSHYEVIVTDSLDQGKCSSCAAFAVTSAFETCVLRTQSGSEKSFLEDLFNFRLPWNPISPATDLSQQNLLDCAFNYNGLAGCDGGQSFRYLQWLQGGGLRKARSWPYVDGGKKFEVAENTSLQAGYTQRPGSYRCKHTPKPDFVLNQIVVSWDDHTERDIENILLDGHAVVTTMDLVDEFQHYMNGVFYSEKCESWLLGPGRGFQWDQEPKSTQSTYGYGYRDQPQQEPLRPLRHAVVIVGFGVDSYGTEYWKVKNSWGPLWGESGFFRILKGYGGHCGLGAYIGVAVCSKCPDGGCDGEPRLPNLVPPADLPQEEVFLGQTTFLSSPVAAQGALTCAQCQSACSAERPCRVFCGPRCQRNGGTAGQQCCRPTGGRGQRIYCPRRGAFCF